MREIGRTEKVLLHRKIKYTSFFFTVLRFHAESNSLNHHQGIVSKFRF